MQSIDMAQNAPASPEDANTVDCCTAYRLLNSTLFQFFATPDSIYPYTVMLNGIGNIVVVQDSAIYHLHSNSERALEVAATADMSEQATVIQEFAASLEANTARHALWYSDDSHPGLVIKANKIQGDKGDEYVLLVLICEDARALIKAQGNVIEVIAQGFADIFRATRQAHISRRHVVQKERAIIARELHDSLAQSLTYLKIQASRIQSLCGEGGSNLTVNGSEFSEVVDGLRDNLNIAYRQLRELMTTFRLTVGGESFHQAIEDSVKEFEKRSTIAFDLDNRLSDDELTIDEEMQVLHIVREAMSNIVRHSHAKRSRVCLRHHDGNNIRITINDDGVGIDKSQRRAQHLGLIIMQERSQNLGGQFRVKELDGSGTKIQVTFLPQKSPSRFNNAENL